MNHSTNTATALSLLFYREGFSFCVYDENGNPGKVNKFRVTQPGRWEPEVMKELEVNLRLRRNFDRVCAAVISPFYNLVPQSYLLISRENLLNLSEAEFENNVLLASSTGHASSFVYGTSQLLLDKLSELYPQVSMQHSGRVFLDSVQYSKRPELHLNLCENNLEALVTGEKGVLFYNLFEIQSDEDILFYTLFALEQLGSDTNKIELKCYGQLLAGTEIYQTLKKYIRYIAPALKNEDFLENYTLFNLLKCASSPEVSEGKK